MSFKTFFSCVFGRKEKDTVKSVSSTLISAEERSLNSYQKTTWQDHEPTADPAVVEPVKEIPAEFADVRIGGFAKKLDIGLILVMIEKGLLKPGMKVFINESEYPFGVIASYDNSMPYEEFIEKYNAPNFWSYYFEENGIDEQWGTIRTELDGEYKLYSLDYAFTPFEMYDTNVKRHERVRCFKKFTGTTFVGSKYSPVIHQRFSDYQTLSFITEKEFKFFFSPQVMRADTVKGLHYYVLQLLSKSMEIPHKGIADLCRHSLLERCEQLLDGGNRFDELRFYRNTGGRILPFSTIITRVNVHKEESIVAAVPISSTTINFSGYVFAKLVDPGELFPETLYSENRKWQAFQWFPHK